MKRLRLWFAVVITIGLTAGLLATTTSVLNPASDLSGKTLVTAEGNRTITGTWSFSVPVRVNTGSNAVPGLVSTGDQTTGWVLGTGTIGGSVNGGNIFTVNSTGAAVTGVFSVSGTSTLTGNVTASGTLTSTGTFFPLGLIDASGASAGQIKFPTVQNPSGNALTLDDYRYGTWTPVIGGSGGTSGQSYTTQLGEYVKIGKQVWVMGNAVLSAKGTITTNVEIQGLPFTSLNPGASGFQCLIEWNALNTTWVHLSAFVNQGGTNVRIFGINAASASSLTSATSLTTSDLTNTSQFTVTCVYQAAQ